MFIEKYLPDPNTIIVEHPLEQDHIPEVLQWPPSFIDVPSVSDLYNNINIDFNEIGSFWNNYEFPLFKEKMEESILRYYNLENSIDENMPDDERISVPLQYILDGFVESQASSFFYYVGTRITYRPSGIGTHKYLTHLLSSTTFNVVNFRRQIQSTLDPSFFKSSIRTLPLSAVNSYGDRKLSKHLPEIKEQIDTRYTDGRLISKPVLTNPWINAEKTTLASFRPTSVSPNGEESLNANGVGFIILNQKNCYTPEQVAGSAEQTHSRVDLAPFQYYNLYSQNVQTLKNFMDTVVGGNYIFHNPSYLISASFNPRDIPEGIVRSINYSNSEHPWLLPSNSKIRDLFTVNISVRNMDQKSNYSSKAIRYQRDPIESYSIPSRFPVAVHVINEHILYRIVNPAVLNRLLNPFVFSPYSDNTLIRGKVSAIFKFWNRSMKKQVLESVATSGMYIQEDHPYDFRHDTSTPSETLTHKLNSGVRYQYLEDPNDDTTEQNKYVRNFDPDEDHIGDSSVISIAPITTLPGYSINNADVTYSIVSEFPVENRFHQRRYLIKINTDIHYVIDEAGSGASSTTTFSRNARILLNEDMYLDVTINRDATISITPFVNQVNSGSGLDTTEEINNDRFSPPPYSTIQTEYKTEYLGLSNNVTELDIIDAFLLDDVSTLSVYNNSWSIKNTTTIRRSFRDFPDPDDQITSSTRNFSYTSFRKHISKDIRAKVRPTAFNVIIMDQSTRVDHEAVKDLFDTNLLRLSVTETTIIDSQLLPRTSILPLIVNTSEQIEYNDLP